MSFAIDLTVTTDVLGRFHRKLMKRRGGLDWASFDASAYDPKLVDNARQQWAGRSLAEYQSTSQFSQLLHRLALVGAPLELIGAATRLVTDECRHAELCARMADVLGGRDGFIVPADSLSLFDAETDPWVAIYRTVLSVCCFGETLSVPMLDAIATVATAPLAQAVAEIIAADEEYHSTYGWELLTWLTPRLTGEQRDKVGSRLPLVMGQFERACGAGPAILETLAGTEITVEHGAPNLGTLSNLQYAAIFYHAMETTIFPGLETLGFDAHGAWEQRVIPA
ncbi:MAG: diiron oxygenase [Bradymonadaceae bacterium]|nr:diiron oxygenase [Lujinxingiaceae bacterium]